jgi:hypothetical protein
LRAFVAFIIPNNGGMGIAGGGGSRFLGEKFEIEGKMELYQILIIKKKVLKIFFYSENSKAVSKNSLKWFKCKFESKLSGCPSLERILAGP